MDWKMKPANLSGHIRLALQFGRFSIVGLAATGVHVAAGVLLVDGWGISPFSGNLGAFLFAVLVSYTGHYGWTFKSTRAHAECFWRFVVVAVICLVLNQTIVYAVVNRLGGSYHLALAIVVIIMPVVGFILNKCWTFHTAESIGSPRAAVPGNESDRA